MSNGEEESKAPNEPMIAEIGGRRLLSEGDGLEPALGGERAPRKALVGVLRRDEFDDDVINGLVTVIRQQGGEQLVDTIKAVSDLVRDESLDVASRVISIGIIGTLAVGIEDGEVSIEALNQVDRVIAVDFGGRNMNIVAYGLAISRVEYLLFEEGRLVVLDTDVLVRAIQVLRTYLRGETGFGSTAREVRATLQRIAQQVPQREIQDYARGVLQEATMAADQGGEA